MDATLSIEAPPRGLVWHHGGAGIYWAHLAEGCVWIRRHGSRWLATVRDAEGRGQIGCLAPTLTRAKAWAERRQA